MCIDVENNSNFNNNSDSNVYKYFDSNVKNKSDIRTQLAYDIIYLNNGVYKISKDTRAGVTTSMQGVCLEEHIPYIIIEPTNSIIRDTNIRDVKRIFNKPDAKIVHIPSNFECIINKELIAENANYGFLDYLLVGDTCSKCEHFNVCPLTEIQRVEEFDAVSLTYDKLVAMKLSSDLYLESTVAASYYKINEVKVRILDEVHDLAFDRMTTLPFMDVSYEHINLFKKKIINAEKEYGKKSFQLIRAIINRYLKIISDPEFVETKEKMKEVFTSSYKDIFRTKHSVKLNNNNYHEIILPKLVTKRSTGEKEVRNIDETNVIGFMIKEIVKLTGIIENYDIDILDVKSIYSMVNIIFAKELNIEIRKIFDRKIKTHYRYDFYISSVDRYFKKTISEYLKDSPWVSKTFLVSATHTEYNYHDLFSPDTIIKNVVFGKNGDPLNANSKLKIFCDSKSFNSFGKNTIETRESEIVNRCKDIMNIYGKNDKVVIVCMNIENYEKITKEFKNSEYIPKITYYRCSDMMGVASGYRVGIHISLAHIPSHAFDSIRESHYEARILAEEKMHCDSWQAMSRVKDPQGIEPSVVFALGCTKRDLDNITSWASDGRLVDIIDTGIGRQTEKNVTLIGEHISKPEIIEAEGWNETLIQSQIHMFGLSNTKGIDCYLCNNLRNLNKDQFTVNSKADLLNKMFGDSKYKTQYKYSNRTFSNKDIQINEKIINEYIEGIKDVYFRPVLNKKTNFISFETDSEVNLCKLKLFFDSNDVPYVIEKLDNNFRLWIFIKENTVSDARKIVYLVFDNVGNKEFRVNLSNELIKLPFGKDSDILIDGKFVNEFTKLNVGTIDIADFDKPLKLNLMSNKNDSSENEGACY